MAAPLIPPWMANPTGDSSARPPPSSPSVSLTLSPAATVATHTTTLATSHPSTRMEALGTLPSGLINGHHIVSELTECCQALEEDHRAWVAHRKEAAWRLRRLELQLEAEKACRKREKMAEFEGKMRALKDEQRLTIERIEAEYREQISGLRREAEFKEQKLADQWAAKHLRMSEFLEQAVGRRRWPPTTASGMDGL